MLVIILIFFIQIFGIIEKCILPNNKVSTYLRLLHRIFLIYYSKEYQLFKCLFFPFLKTRSTYLTNLCKYFNSCITNIY